MSTATTTSIELPGYVAGTYTIDPVHTDVSFTVRHMMVSKVRGKFSDIKGTISLPENPLDAATEVEIDLSSIDTSNPDRDSHIRSADFFDVEHHPAMTYRSTGIRPDGGDWSVDGELSLKGVTRPVQLHLELYGFAKDPFGGTRVGFTATGQLSRKDFGVDIDMPMDGGGVVIGDKISLLIEVEAILDEGEL